MHSDNFASTAGTCRIQWSIDERPSGCFAPGVQGFDFLFCLGFMVRQDYFTHLEQSQSIGGAKTEEPRKKHLITHKQILAYLTCDPS